MAETILIGVAWPYANGSLHLGHVAGCYLPADIFARYHRCKGNKVLMVSGSDVHGTPITIKALQEGTTPAEVADKYHQEFIECWKKLGISFDLFTTTETPNHTGVVHDIFNKLYGKKYIYEDEMPLPYCPRCQRYLPDRYVEGTCPLCGYQGARGDQCDKCGKPLNPTDLLGAKCRFCGTAPETRLSKHLFLKLSAFRDELYKWLRQQNHWRANVLNFSIKMVEDGLKDRAITRDIDWGVSIPLEGYEDKRIYVWFEAVIGYLSASKEWAKLNKKEDAWREFWGNGARSYYFIGKDNTPFHTIIWPAMLMGYGGLNLPYDVPANEFLLLEGKQLSTSRNWAVWLPYYLSRYDPDPLRYFLSAAMPETSDSDFSWKEFYRRNNNELVATYGNLVHRVLSFTYRSFNGHIPSPVEIDGQGKALLAKSDETLHNVDKQLAKCNFREALKSCFSLAQEANRYLDEQAPWKKIKENKEQAGNSLFIAITAISTLKTVLYPFLPFSSTTLHSYLGFQGGPDNGWQVDKPVPGQKLLEPKPLFTKLDDKGLEEENLAFGLKH